MMKAVAIIACVLAINIATSASEKIMESTKKWTGLSDSEIESCFESTGVTIDDIHILENTEEKDYDKEEMDKRLKKLNCWIACIFQKVDVMKGSEIQADALHKLAEEKWSEYMKDDTHAKIDKCVAEVKDISDKCEVAFALSNCLMVPQQEN